MFYFYVYFCYYFKNRILAIYSNIFVTIYNHYLCWAVIGIYIGNGVVVYVFFV